MHMCMDFCTWNASTCVDQYPIPRVEDLLDGLYGAHMFLKIDLCSGYYQVQIREGHQHYATFQSYWGLYEYTVILFRLVNATAMFECIMNKILHKYLDICCMVCPDDILILGKFPSEHEEHLHQVLQQLQMHKFYAKHSKYSFCLRSIDYLGNVISAQGISTDPLKIVAIRKWPKAQTQKEVKQFLGLANFFSKLIASYADIAALLTDLTESYSEWLWTEAEQSLFDRLKAALVDAPVLDILDLTESALFVFEIEASDIAIGLVLLQDQGSGLQPAAYFSRELSSAQCNYPIHQQELLAIVELAKRWHPYLAGHTTRVLTDHKPVTFLPIQHHLSKQQVRWIEQLAETDLQINYHPSPQAVVLDAISISPDYGDCE